MAVHDTVENQRSKLTKRSVNSILSTVDLDKHELIISDNGSCEETQEFYNTLPKFIRGIKNEENIGTARAVNKGIARRKDGEHCIKIDNDILFSNYGWVDEMEEVLQREPNIGILGLKRKDIWQHPNHENPDYRTQLVSLQHEPGERWINVEVCKDIMGSCTMLNSKLIDTIGYLRQPGVYGFDDVLYSLRSILAGFDNAFLPHIEIQHLDPGGDDYTHWKHYESGAKMNAFNQLYNLYTTGQRPLYEHES